jgi:hypothetical protein
MVVRQIRAILAKLPDDAVVSVQIKDTRISVPKVLYAAKHNMVCIPLDMTEVEVAYSSFMQAEIDGLEDL